ncbi:MAG TPA: DNA-processing protein DprA [Solirubrobacterales bacterium]|nr:DNA-processing protein DprA [Solirubrobacterales bacterium]
MAEASACVECLRRSWLLAALGPYVEKIATGEVGRRSPELLRLSNEDLVEVAAPKLAGQLLARVEALPEERLLEELLLAECWACCRHGDLYPDSLRDAADAPWALIGRGNPKLLDGLESFEAVTVVGARRATSYGREVARELGRELAAAGMTVVSGLAFGIDACAHRGALDAGRTIAVLGCGPDIAYPASHRSLWRRVCELGAVISEFPPGATPWRWTFPARNRIMAALAGMTVVVEAAARSGSLITTDLAADLGRDLGAVPGPVNSRASAGPNGLLVSGAHVIRDAQDVLDAMLGPGRKRIEHRGPELDAALGAALAAVESGHATCDAVATATGLPGSAAASALARLELLGYLTCSNLGTYSRTLMPSTRASL